VGWEWSSVGICFYDLPCLYCRFAFSHYLGIDLRGVGAFRASYTHSRTLGRGHYTTTQQHLWRGGAGAFLKGINSPLPIPAYSTLCTSSTVPLMTRPAINCARCSLLPWCIISNLSPHPTAPYNYGPHNYLLPIAPSYSPSPSSIPNPNPHREEESG
jgi:hypothetical protein